MGGAAAERSGPRDKGCCCAGREFAALVLIIPAGKFDRQKSRSPITWSLATLPPPPAESARIQTKDVIDHSPSMIFSSASNLTGLLEVEATLAMLGRSVLREKFFESTQGAFGCLPFAEDDLDAHR